VIAGIGTHELQIAREGPVASMGRDELRYFRAMAMLDPKAFAEKLDVAPEQYLQMEAGIRLIPKRFDEDIYNSGWCVHRRDDRSRPDVVEAR
jgi:hypothetical protein